jgi:hypothetical protein
MNILIISNTPIRQDAEGRYSLNDLHRAAGGEDKRKPALFTNRPKTMALIQNINTRNGAIVEGGTVRLSNAPAIAAKPKLGTYGCQEVALAYAYWIGPEFHLEVAHAFNAWTEQLDERQSKIEPIPNSAFDEQAAATQRLYADKCKSPSREDLLNNLYELDQPLECRALAHLIHSAWDSDAAISASIRIVFKTDAAFGAFIRAWFKKDFLEVAEIEAEEEMECRSDSPEPRADNTCNELAPMGEAV